MGYQQSSGKTGHWTSKAIHFWAHHLEPSGFLLLISYGLCENWQAPKPQAGERNKKPSKNCHQFVVSSPFWDKPKKKHIAPTVSQQVSQCLLDHFIHFSPIDLWQCSAAQMVKSLIQWKPAGWERESIEVNPRTHHQPTIIHIIYRLVICLYLFLSPYFDGFFLTLEKITMKYPLVNWHRPWQLSGLED